MRIAIDGDSAAATCHQGAGRKKVAELPAGQLFWRIENFTALAQAQAAGGPWPLVAESAGKVWLFTLGPAGGSSPGGTKVAELDQSPGSLHRSISFGSTKPAALRAA